jgi:hypothetical protein
MIFGLLFSLQTICASLDPTPSRIPTGQKLKAGEGCAFRNFATSTYRLHLFATLTGLRFALFTDPAAMHANEALQALYRDCYVPYAMRNPIYDVGETITGWGFEQAVDHALRLVSI